DRAAGSARGMDHPDAGRHRRGVWSAEADDRLESGYGTRPCVSQRKSGGTDLRIALDLLPSQWKFINSKPRFKGFSGPVGSGKSRALCYHASSCAISNPGLTGLLAAPTMPLLQAATLASWFSVLRENDIAYDWSKTEGVVTVSALDSRILLRSLTEA